MAESPPQGWYPDPAGSDKLRWWDGAQWTKNLQDPPPAPEPEPPSASSPAPGETPLPQPFREATTPERPTVASASPPPASEAGEAKPWWRRTWVLVAAGVVALLLVVGALSPDNKESPASDGADSSSSSAETATDVAQPVAEVTVKRPDDGAVVRRQKFTLSGTATPGTEVEVDGRAAKMSADGSWTRRVTADIGPNSYTVTASGSGFEDSEPTDLSITRKRTAAERAALRAARARARARAEAEREARAARRANARALESAQNYLDLGGFSKQGLYEQLSSDAGEGFTAAEAQYAVDNVGADWNQEAVEAARSYLETSSFSRSALIEQLSSSAGSGFTYEQAVYAVNKVY